MGTIIENRQLAADMFLCKVSGCYAGDMGQFYMLRGWTDYPLLSRPISIHDVHEDGITFLYRVRGVGTANMSQLRIGDELQLEGPYGKGFPQVNGRVGLVGGGMGTAPLLYAAKQLIRAGTRCEAYLGFQDAPFRVDAFERVLGAEHVHVQQGGSVVDIVDIAGCDHLFVCGPTGMMEALWQQVRGTNAILHVSVEKRMACGVGACLGCSGVRADGGRYKACTDGPVFRAEEVDFDDLYVL
ncbi:dihydroorotate dehydrogenase electron transfer subunit [Marinicrinis sediminis]|uniref:Dihydroorotate dehydrogenase electron transfer subunit n=1 Tax=Marinicrinis sediminis TaxID=1652465 RepID=A0ABW5RBF8_9BACL